MCQPPSYGCVRWRACGLPYPASGPVGDGVPASRCTSAFLQVRHGAGDAAAARHFTRPSLPRRRPIVQWRPMGVGGDSPARRPWADGLCTSPVALPPYPPLTVLSTQLPAMLIVRRRRWGPVIGQERRRVRPMIALPPPSRLLPTIQLRSPR